MVALWTMRVSRTIDGHDVCCLFSAVGGPFYHSEQINTNDYRLSAFPNSVFFTCCSLKVIRRTQKAECNAGYALKVETLSPKPIELKDQ